MCKDNCYLAAASTPAKKGQPGTNARATVFLPQMAQQAQLRGFQQQCGFANKCGL
jgi:hypothetical protein